VEREGEGGREGGREGSECAVGAAEERKARWRRTGTDRPKEKRSGMNVGVQPGPESNRDPTGICTYDAGQRDIKGGREVGVATGQYLCVGSVCESYFPLWSCSSPSSTK
jgi:hypothetical protein